MQKIIKSSAQLSNRNFHTDGDFENKHDIFLKQNSLAIHPQSGDELIANI